ncbi:MAG: tRNA-intron lyase [Candidatus Thorarchaeota archaeon]|nr:tRNA-intron lyase [Candidatus Thorarchaeota archaeon]
MIQLEPDNEPPADPDHVKEPETPVDSEKPIPEEEVEEEPAEAMFRDGKAYISGPDADRISQQGIYGTRLKEGELELLPVEILHLLERKRIVVRTPDGVKLSAREIVNSLFPTNPDLWTQYLVFRDLRSRGYAVRQGFGGGIGYRVYARGDRPGTASANQLIYMLKDGEPISLHDLDMVTQTAASARKKLAFALVDQNGEVNFYRVAQVILDNRSTNENE